MIDFEESLELILQRTDEIVETVDKINRHIKSLIIFIIGLIIGAII